MSLARDISPWAVACLLVLAFIGLLCLLAVAEAKDESIQKRLKTACERAGGRVVEAHGGNQAWFCEDRR